MEHGPSPGDRGMRTEAAVASALVRSGARVFLPAFGSNGRVDLIYERDHHLTRVQCKTACIIGESLRFWTSAYTNKTATSYDGQIDEFGVHAPDLEIVYLVPIDAVPTRACFLRTAPTRNGQWTGVRWAADYELGPP